MKYIDFIGACSSYFSCILHLSLVTFFLVTFSTETETREYQNLFLLFISSYFLILHKFQMSCLKFIPFLFLKKKCLNVYSAWTLKICIATSTNSKALELSEFFLFDAYLHLIIMKYIIHPLHSMGIILCKVPITSGSLLIWHFEIIFAFYSILFFSFYFFCVNSFFHLWLQNLHF